MPIPEQPAREWAKLTVDELSGWVAFINKEIRHDTNAWRARKIIAGTLDAVAEEADGWCACEEHVNALSVVVKTIWREDT